MNRGMKKRAPERALELIRGEKGKGGAAGNPPRRPRARARLDTGRAPSTGQRRPALPRADPAVPSALGGLASGFGMGPGVPRPPWPLTGGRRSSCDVRVPPTLEGSFRVPWGPHSELAGPYILDSTFLSCTRQAHGNSARGDATGKSSGD